MARVLVVTQLWGLATLDARGMSRTSDTRDPTGPNGAGFLSDTAGADYVRGWRARLVDGVVAAAHAAVGSWSDRADRAQRVDASEPSHEPGKPREARAFGGVRASSAVVANRRVPHVTAPSPFRGFSAQPTDDEIFRRRIFSEPLVPVGARTTPAENRALTRALERLHRGPSDTPESPTAVLAFLDAYPQTPWRASLLVNLGTQYRDVGAYPRALAAYQAAWETARGERRLDAPGRVIADLALAEWLALATQLGQIDAVRARMPEATARQMSGAPAEKLSRVRERLAWLRDGARGGVPIATRAEQYLTTFLHDRAAAGERSTRRDGDSRASGRDILLRPARRLGGAAWPVPAVVHLRQGRVVALLSRTGDRFLAYDPLLAQHIFLHRETLDADATGYARVPRAALAGRAERARSISGWTEVSPALLAGSSYVCPPGTPGDGEPPCDRCEPSMGMATYSLQPSIAGLVLRDDPVGYTPPVGPAMTFGLTYTSRPYGAAAVSTFGNLGPNWRFNWLAYVEERAQACNPINCIDAEARVYLRGGGHEAHPPPVSGSVFPRHWRSQAQLVRTSSTPGAISYERRLPDGSKEIYGQQDGSVTGIRVFLTALVDAQGRTVTLTYDEQMRLVAVTDAIGQVSALAYEHPSDPTRITKITDPFGRAAVLTYNARGQLASVTDTIGLTSAFTYGANDFITQLTTPYGTATFLTEDDTIVGPRFIEVIDPTGGRERVEYWIEHPTLTATVPSAQVPTGFAAANSDLHRYVTLSWDRQAMALQPRALTSATITKWLLRQGPDWGGAVTSRVPHSIKKPLEARDWYLYAGQSPAVGSTMVGTSIEATTAARVMDDGTTRTSQATYNALGHVTSRTDPLGRRTSYVYAGNGIDLTEVRQTTGSLNDLLAEYDGYTAAHQPTLLTDAAGQTATLTYNAYGQVLTTTNAKSETTTSVYDANGYLESTTGAIAGATTSYTYDTRGRVRTVTDPDGYVVTTDYDLFDRPVKTTYPDGTFEETVYDKLDPVRRRDRLGRWTYLTYDALRRLIATRDPLGRTIQQQWCTCGSLEALIDGKGQKTRWERDVQGRVTREIRADNTTTTTYTYEVAGGRLKTMTDPKLQVTTYTYYADATLQQVTYTNAQIATPSVSYTYDTDYNRLATMVDGIGTTMYTYKVPGALGAGQVASVDGPLADDTITYVYDELGRVVLQAINGAANQTARAYDALGRVTSETNRLGSFTFEYDGSTPRLATMLYPNGQKSYFEYYSSLGDHRLLTIHHKSPVDATLSRFDYAYDAIGNITSWKRQVDNGLPLEWRYVYDGADQLLSAYERRLDTTPEVLARFVYSYDHSSNLTTTQIDNTVTLYTYDILNRLVNQQAGGRLRVMGELSEPGSVAIQGGRVQSDLSGRFDGSLKVEAGITVFTLTATDANGNSSLQTYELDISPSARTFVYDPNGNLVADGVRTLEWDAANRLRKIASALDESEFTYGGNHRRVGTVERHAGAVVNADVIVWDSDEPAELRATMPAASTTRFIWGGVERGANSTFLTWDHISNIRDITSQTGARLNRLDYEPYGRRRDGAIESIGFTGSLEHATSGLLFMERRVYDPDISRWLSEDPIGLQAGPNRYGYVLNNPVKWLDPSGLFPVMVTRPRWGLPSNGNVWPGSPPADGRCTWPAGLVMPGINDNPCYLMCCLEHDACYKKHQCNWSSWLRQLPATDCGDCNGAVIYCIGVTRANGCQSVCPVPRNR